MLVATCQPCLSTANASLWSDVNEGEETSEQVGKAHVGNLGHPCCLQFQTRAKLYHGSIFLYSVNLVFSQCLFGHMVTCSWTQGTLAPWLLMVPRGCQSQFFPARVVGKDKWIVRGQSQAFGVCTVVTLLCCGSYMSFQLDSVFF